MTTERELDDEGLALLRRARRGHYYCEDSWYSCPKAEGGCADDSQGTDCTCGAAKWNAELDAYLARPRIAAKQMTEADVDEAMRLADWYQCSGDAVNIETNRAALRAHLMQFVCSAKEGE